MPWDRSAPTDPKYRSKEHRAVSAKYKRSIREGQTLRCTAMPCLLPSEDITNPNGDDDDGVTVGHADNGIDIAGPQHRVCNSQDGAVRGRARQEADTRWVL